MVIESILTPRELETLLYLAEGLSNSAIAAEMVIDERVVECYCNVIYSALDVSKTDGHPERSPRVLAARWLWEQNKLHVEERNAWLRE